MSAPRDIGASLYSNSSAWIATPERTAWSPAITVSTTGAATLSVHDSGAGASFADVLSAAGLTKSSEHPESAESDKTAIVARTRSPGPIDRPTVVERGRSGYPRVPVNISQHASRAAAMSFAESLR